jgi:site-specific DNA recombinase
LRAAIYARVSTPRQGEEEKASIKEQITAIESYCRNRDYSITDHYIDNGYPGTKSKRPEFQRMITDAKKGMFNVIVCWKADRLSRGMYPAAALMEAIEPLDIRIEASEETFDMNTFALLTAVGKIELDNIRKRTQMGRKYNIEHGNHHIRPPFGWDYGDINKRWAINEAEANWVRQIYNWYITGVSVSEIARRLNKSGVLTKNMSRLGWTAQRISALVNSECYKGIAYYNKRFGSTGKAKDKKDWIQMHDIPPIISHGTWLEAQSRRLNNRRFSPRNTKVVYLTQNILICEECGKSFLIHSGKQHPRLMCRGTTLYPHIFECRKPKSLLYQPIAKRLWDAVRSLLSSEVGLQTAIDHSSKQIAGTRKEIEKTLSELNKERQCLNLERDRVITWARKGSITENELDLQLRAIQAEDEQYSTKLDKIRSDLILHTDTDTVYQQAKKLIPIIRERLNDGLSLEEKRDLIKLLVRRVLLDKNGDMTIEFKVPEPEGCFGYCTTPHAE